MQPRTIRAISGLVFLALVGGVALYALARRDCYTWPDGETALGEILLGCELEGPLPVVIRGCRAAAVPALFPLESDLACRYRDRHVADYVRWDPASGSALHRLAETHASCRGQESTSAACARAHLAAIDWLLAAGLPVDAVAYGKTTALQIAVARGDEALFAALLARGADPDFLPPDDDARTAIELLRWQIARADRRHTPETLARWERMLARATSPPGPEPGLREGATAGLTPRVEGGLW